METKELVELLIAQIGRANYDENLAMIVFRSPEDWVDAVHAAIAAVEAAERQIGHKAEEVAVVEDLLALTEALYYTLDDSEQISDGEHIIQDDHYSKLVAITERLDALPDDRPGYIMSYPGKARWALRHLLDTGTQAQIEDK